MAAFGADGFAPPAVFAVPVFVSVAVVVVAPAAGVVVVVAVVVVVGLAEPAAPLAALVEGVVGSAAFVSAVVVVVEVDVDVDVDPGAAGTSVACTGEVSAGFGAPPQAAMKALVPRTASAPATCCREIVGLILGCSFR